MSWNVLITASALSVEPVGARALERLEAAGCTIVHPPKYGPLTEAELLPQLRGIDAVMAGMDPFNRTVLSSEEAKDLKIISRWGVGYDAVDLVAAAELGIVVCNTPGLLNEAVADYTFALLLGLARRIPEGSVSLRAGRWESEWGPDLLGKTLGLIGCGGIGQAVARRARGFDIRLLGCDPAPTPEAEQLGIQFVPLEQLLAESDFVSLHTALTPDTRELIGAPELRAMKPSAYLINTARGAIIDEAAIGQALREEWIAGAALDVFTTEPLPADHPLHGVPNLQLTPHQASLGYESGARVSGAGADAILAVRAGERPRWVLNPDVFESPAFRVAHNAPPPDPSS
ncbi:MAG: phosphoglycerate dehydrogenase-like enzyme [Kiritimatiellia bacterium]|jgi:phosphoglycerate dehydrogenase-like enzyme